MTTKNDIYQSVTDSIVKLLESGVEPWRKAWNDDPKAAPSMLLPVNAATGRPYSGINVLLLWSAAQERGFTQNAWLTYNQAQELGGHVRKGERGTMVVLWKKVPDHKARAKNPENENAEYLLARAFWVFNVAQVDELPELKHAPLPTQVTPVSADEVLAFAHKVGADVRHGGNRAYYVPSADFIQLPKPEQFEHVGGYRATALHELTHWTGHESRLARKFGERFGDEAYAFEELIAELGSAFLCASLGIENAPLEHHASYVDHWLKVLKNDKRAIFTAASQSQKAANYCLEHASDEPVKVAA